MLQGLIAHAGTLADAHALRFINDMYYIQHKLYNVLYIVYSILWRLLLCDFFFLKFEFSGESFTFSAWVRTPKQPGY